MRGNHVGVTPGSTILLEPESTRSITRGMADFSRTVDDTLFSTKWPNPRKTSYDTGDRQFRSASCSGRQIHSQIQGRSLLAYTPTVPTGWARARTQRTQRRMSSSALFAIAPVTTRAKGTPLGLADRHRSALGERRRRGPVADGGAGTSGCADGARARSGTSTGPRAGACAAGSPRPRADRSPVRRGPDGQADRRCSCRCGRTPSRWRCTALSADSARTRTRRAPAAAPRAASGHSPVSQVAVPKPAAQVRRLVLTHDLAHPALAIGVFLATAGLAVGQRRILPVVVGLEHARPPLAGDHRADRRADRRPTRLELRFAAVAVLIAAWTWVSIAWSSDRTQSVPRRGADARAGGGSRGGVLLRRPPAGAIARRSGARRHRRRRRVRTPDPALSGSGRHLRPARRLPARRTRRLLERPRHPHGHGLAGGARDRRLRGANVGARGRRREPGRPGAHALLHVQPGLLDRAGRG